MIYSKDIPKTILITGSFIWVGLICGISFLESWLKFQAPGMTLELGVAIGRLVFSALNKVEIVLAGIISISWWKIYHGHQVSNSTVFLIGLTLIVLMVQTLVLLPAMDKRAILRLLGQGLETSFLHIYYVAGEMFKVICLSLLGLKSIK